MCTQLIPACSQQRLASVTLTKIHPHSGYSGNGTKSVWETVRWHGINWENVPTGHPGRHLYTCSQLNAIGPPHLQVEMQAGSTTCPVTATDLVTGMSSLFSIMKRNWTNWMRKPKSVISCKEHCSYITDACRECAVVPVLLGTVQLLFPEWPQCLQKLKRHGACYWKLWPQKRLQFGFLNFIYMKKDIIYTFLHEQSNVNFNSGTGLGNFAYANTSIFFRQFSAFREQGEILNFFC